MTSFNLFDIINTKSAISPKAGLIAYDHVESLLSKGEKITIDFTSVEDITSAFCNAFIGKLYMNFDTKLLNDNFHIVGIISDIWNKKVQNAILLGTNENIRSIRNENINEVIFS